MKVGGVKKVVFTVTLAHTKSLIEHKKIKTRGGGHGGRGPRGAVIIIIIIVMHLQKANERSLMPAARPERPCRPAGAPRLPAPYGRESQWELTVEKESEREREDQFAQTRIFTLTVISATRVCTASRGHSVLMGMGAAGC